MEVLYRQHCTQGTYITQNCVRSNKQKDKLTYVQCGIIIQEINERKKHHQKTSSMREEEEKKKTSSKSYSQTKLLRRQS